MKTCGQWYNVEYFNTINNPFPLSRVANLMDYSQTVNRLKTFLDQNTVEYTEKLFNTSAGIKGIGNPFVSSDYFSERLQEAVLFIMVITLYVASHHV